MTEDLWQLTAAELAAGYASQAFTPSNALAEIHQRIDALNPTLNAIVSEDRTGAKCAAQQADIRWQAGKPLSPLDGIPMTIKDNLLCVGFPATWGSALYKDNFPDRDEAPIARLRAAGAVFLGKTNVPEFTLQGFTSNVVWGTTTNPHTQGLTPGGSSGGGAAAVAAGFGPIAIGTDGGGSLRRPAAHCGLYAHKPSVGQIARYDGFPEILGDFEVVGPIARTVEDLEIVFDTLSDLGPDEVFSTQLRIAFLPRLNGHPIDCRVSVACNAWVEKLKGLGHQVTEIQAPYDLEAVTAAWSDVAAAGLAWHLGECDGPTDIDANAQTFLAKGEALSTAALLQAQSVARAIRAAAGELMADYDLLICPSIAALAWQADEPFPLKIDGQAVGPRGHAIFTAWMNVAGLAVVNLPLEMTEESGGIGLQLVAAVGRDRALLGFAKGLPDLLAPKRAALATVNFPAQHKNNRESV